MTEDIQPPQSTRIPIARLELFSGTHKPITDELDAVSKALLVEFSWSDLSPPPLAGHKSTYTLEWDGKPIILPTLENQKWEWDAPIQTPAEIVYDGTKEVKEGEEEETVLVLVLLQGIEPHIPKVYLQQKHDAIAPPDAANIVTDEEVTAPLEIPVKTLAPTYPLSSEFLGANYRHISDLVMKEVTTASKNRTPKGILHTVFAVKKLDELLQKIKAGEADKSTREQKTWLQKEFGLSLPSLTISANTEEIGEELDLVRSPTATSKEWTSQLDLAAIDTSADGPVEDPPVPWSATSTLPDTPIKPSIRPSRPGSIPSTPASAMFGLGIDSHFTNSAHEPHEDFPIDRQAQTTEDYDKEDEEDDLFQLPLSPRTTNDPSNPFSDAQTIDGRSFNRNAIVGGLPGST